MQNVTAVALDLPGAIGTKGLSGLNVLGERSVQMDRRRGRLILWQGGKRR